MLILNLMVIYITCVLIVYLISLIILDLISVITRLMAFLTLIRYMIILLLYIVVVILLILLKITWKELNSIMRKHRLNKRYSKKMFSRNAIKTHRKNLMTAAVPMRGGYRL